MIEEERQSVRALRRAVQASPIRERKYGMDTINTTVACDTHDSD